MSANLYRNFIGGQWVQSGSGKTVANINPANTDDIIGHAPQSTREEAQAAIAAAQAAFPAWRGMPAPARGRILAKAGQLCGERKEEIARLMTREEGKTLSESRGEVQKAINLLEYYAGAAFGRGTHLAERDAEHVCLYGSATARRCQCDHAMEFSSLHPGLENGARAGGGQYRRLQGGQQHAGMRRVAGENLRGGRSAVGVVISCTAAGHRRR